MTDRQAYEKKFQAQLDAWSAEIDQLKARAAEAEADLQLEYRRRIEDLHAMQQAAGKMLAEMRSAGDDAWKDLKTGLDGARDTLENAFRTARSRF